MSVSRKEAMKLDDVRWFDVDMSAQMFEGQFIKSFEPPGGGSPVSFLFRRIDPGTLLELTGNALFLAGETDGKEDILPLAPTSSVDRSAQLIKDLKVLKIRTTHRLEVLHRCILRPTFETLEQLKRIPTEWQVALYNEVMRHVLGGNCLLTGRFPRACQGE